MTSAAPPRTFSRVGGHAALDLVNTVQWRLSAERFEEDLSGYEHLVAWARQTEVIGDAEADALRELGTRHPKRADEEAARVRRLREALYRALFEGADAAEVGDEYRQAVAAGELRPDAGKWRWRFPLDLSLPRRRIALEVHDLLVQGDLQLLSQCNDAECGWVFLDTSPRHNRRWCVSADCGNRNRVREFYERSRARAGTGQPSGG